jgi:hypothetical protein
MRPKGLAQNSCFLCLLPFQTKHQQAVKPHLTIPYSVFRSSYSPLTTFIRHRPSNSQPVVERPYPEYEDAQFKLSSPYTPTTTITAVTIDLFEGGLSEIDALGLSPLWFGLVWFGLILPNIAPNFLFDITHARDVSDHYNMRRRRNLAYSFAPLLCFCALIYMLSPLRLHLWLLLSRAVCLAVLPYVLLYLNKATLSRSLRMYWSMTIESGFRIGNNVRSYVD